MKVMLSHPMTGFSEDYIMAIRFNAENYLKRKYRKIEIIDNYHHEDAPKNAGRLWHLGKSIQQLGEVDAVYFCDKWWKAKGCLVEMVICKLYKIQILK